jgi:hypothetical protein
MKRHRAQPGINITDELIDKALAAAVGAMREYMKDTNFFPDSISRHDPKIVWLLQGDDAVELEAKYGADYIRDLAVQRQENWRKTLNGAIGILNWCAFCMKKDAHNNPVEFLARSYYLVRDEHTAQAYLSKKGYEVFMEELGINVAQLRVKSQAVMALF